MRTDEEYRQILQLWEQGMPKKRIALLTGIPRATVSECIVRYGSAQNLEIIRAALPPKPLTSQILEAGVADGYEELFQSYPYVLALYLGDGYINKEPRSYKLRIFLDTSYPKIIQSCIEALQVLFPSNKISTLKLPYNCVEVICLNNFLPELFPQYGPGMKHTRPIMLEDWQINVIIQYPQHLLRGFIHSDGCRAANIVKDKDYARYEFCNNSDDIKRIFCDACNQLGVHWTLASNGRKVQIARRVDVAFLDQFMGPKA